MRLIDTTTLQLVEFPSNDTPPYAILSHTWSSDEVSLQEFAGDHGLIEQREGFKKIKSCCQMAKDRDQLRYCWVDTCTIDKTSSAELSEAINSMFKWYSQAAICYAYLSDVVWNRASEFSKSRWFTRGWTLQELLPPTDVFLFNSSWTEIGSRFTLTPVISNVTGINEITLLDPANLPRVSIAQRMSWAASRKTTRIQDIAYCLLGIFNVNMPLLYGEGERAFVRLQEEIIKESSDQSILAWDAKWFRHEDGWDTLGVLARHPRTFKDAGGMEYLPAEGKPMTMTSRGLQAELPIIEQGVGVFAAVINCMASTAAKGPYGELSYQVAIPIQLTSLGDGSFGRSSKAPLVLIPEIQLDHCRPHSIYLYKANISSPKPSTFDFLLRNPQFTGYTIQNSVYTTKPLNDLTSFRSWTYQWPKPSNDFTLTNLDLPLGRADCVAAFLFTHLVDPSQDIMLLLESRRARQRWSVRLVSCDRDAQLETVIRNMLSTSQHIVRPFVMYDKKEVRVDATIERMGSLARDRNQSYMEPLTLADGTGWRYTGSRVRVEFFGKAQEGRLRHELHEECKAQSDGSGGAYHPAHS